MIVRVSGNMYELDERLAEMLLAAVSVPYGRLVIEFHGGRPTQKYELTRFIQTEDRASTDRWTAQKRRQADLEAAA